MLSRPQDEDVYTFFEPVLPADLMSIARTKLNDGLKPQGERKSSLKLPANRNGTKSPHSKTQRPFPNSSEKRTALRPSPETHSWNVLDLKVENYFSCAVGRPRTNARYLLVSSDDVVSFLKQLADASLSHRD